MLQFTHKQLSVMSLYEQNLLLGKNQETIASPIQEISELQTARRLEIVHTISFSSITTHPSGLSKHARFRLWNYK